MIRAPKKKPDFAVSVQTRQKTGCATKDVRDVKFQI